MCAHLGPQSSIILHSWLLTFYVCLDLDPDLRYTVHELATMLAACQQHSVASNCEGLVNYTVSASALVVYIFTELTSLARAGIIKVVFSQVICGMQYQLRHTSCQLPLHLVLSNACSVTRMEISLVQGYTLVLLCSMDLARVGRARLRIELINVTYSILGSLNAILTKLMVNI